MAQDSLLGSLKKVTSLQGLGDFILGSSSKTLQVVVRRPVLRRMVLALMDRYLKKAMLGDKMYSEKARQDKYHMYRAFAVAINKALDNAKGKPYEKAIVNSVIPKLVDRIVKSPKVKESFKEKYGIMPPGFLTISPGKFCNLQCTGCYANSSAASSEKIEWDVVDRIVTEKTRDWGSWFTVISGGEPFAWRSQGKGLLELAKKHPENLFLVYTNSVLITKEVAKKLADLGNVTPAISVEGFEKETDKRRGEGVHAKILEAMENLKEVGVPFGISVTATRENAELIMSDKLMDYYFDKGAAYCWVFQLMPIGRAQIEMMITPEQRKEMFDKVKHLIRDKKYFLADFWNCGAVVNGCLSAGKTNGGGYLYIEWNGNITPCVFNPYAAANINDIYKQGKSLNDVVVGDYFSKIREWQHNYGLGNKKGPGYGNWILPCPIRDHYEDIKKIIVDSKAKPIDDIAAEAIKDTVYEKKMKEIDKSQEKILNPVWEKEYQFGIGDELRRE